VLQGRFGNGLPALDRAPVVRHEVHGLVRADLVDHRDEVVLELVELVVSDAGRAVGLTGATHVVGHHVKIPGQQFGDGVPHSAVVRVAVHQHDGGPARITPLLDGQPYRAGHHRGQARGLAGCGRVGGGAGRQGGGHGGGHGSRIVLDQEPRL